MLRRNPAASLATDTSIRLDLEDADTLLLLGSLLDVPGDLVLLDEGGGVLNAAT